MKKRNLIVFMGPLPPPVHGFSEINLRMLDMLQNHAEVFAFDLSPRHGTIHTLLTPIKFTWKVISKKPNSLYIGLSGGIRQWMDFTYIVLAKLFGIRVFIHHHSFAYINTPRKTLKARFQIVPDAMHIVLCECMKSKLSNTYSIPEKNVIVLSNAAFISRTATTPLQQKTRKLTAGFLSNISREKGIFEFLTILEKAHLSGVEINAKIAGPVSPEIQHEFKERLKLLPFITYIGAVYGEKKLEFLSSIDTLIFPTLYANEAEPVTIFEAMEQATPVIAFSRGCIAEQIPAGAGLVVKSTDNTHQEVIDYLRYLAEPENLLNAKKSSHSAFIQASATGGVQLRNLFEEITSKNTQKDE
ncbi:glycosyltransferase family 1 protein [Azotobacter chroococcum]|uniref:glycosyltransferase family 4 protein n=1 Tax=Azotobacter chroococcum TaxID=353 RepID=UPI00103F1516|nr:glycosyltransferase family 4 protein [Azotobacter chroococcum]TBW09314.1 glycosyltransferase family 1 protein [Azotobacter chroococcum]